MNEQHAGFSERREIIEQEDGRPAWWVRLLLALGGIALLAGAIYAWQMQDSFGGRYAMMLPWLIVGAILVGGAAIVESITAEIWVTLIGGIFILLAAYVISGRVDVQIDAAAHQAYVVDRFTGQVRICNGVTATCREVSGFGTVSGVSAEATQKAREKAAEAAEHAKDSAVSLAKKAKGQ